MTKNAWLNALGAAAYIVLISSLMFNAEHWVGPVDTVMAPIAMLSLLVLSASLMSFIFFYQPIRLYVDGDKSAAVKLLLTTIGVFALFTASFLVLLVLW